MKLRLNPFKFVDLTHPHGWLPNEMGAQACWYFYVLAQKNKEVTGTSTESQILYEGELWMDKQYIQIARSVALMYGLDSPDEFAKFWPYVIMQAKELGLPRPAEEYMRLAPGIVRGSTH